MLHEWYRLHRDLICSMAIDAIEAIGKAVCLILSPEKYGKKK